MVSFASLVCKNCAQPMPLPEPTRPGASQHQRWWPSDGLPRNFLCPLCKHVFEYSAKDVRPVPFDATLQDGVRKHRNVVCLKVVCGTGTPRCVSTVRIRTLTAFDAVPLTVAAEILQNSVAHAISCDRGHVLEGPHRADEGEPLGAHFDEDWQRDPGDS
jgi:hypothetical protein